ncbi:MAG TPA: tyrosine-type recombinase/integrase [Candidatus Nanoarchaeia archaeon]|nr:tyrosine-type recombinase/integrase [Candidatus Nanoarchaeia archaeon]
MTTDEAKTLWKYAGRWGTKFQIMLGFALFRGMRIGEICALNIYDFQDAGFQNFNIIFEKSHIQDSLPLLKEFNLLLKEYILKNLHTFKDGYLFPYHNSKRHARHMTANTASACFSKLRKILGKEYPEFLEGTEVQVGNETQKRYRIAWHSCRRWFETTLYDSGMKVEEIADIMRYQKKETVYTYLDPYKTWKREKEILQQTFGELFNEFNNVSSGQTKLSNYFENAKYEHIRDGLV